MASSRVRTDDAVELVGELLNGRPRGFGTRWTLLKTALACAVSFAIAQALSATELAIFAPVLALTTVQASVYGTISQGIQRVLGTMAGVILATVYIDLVGEVTWWSIGIAVLISAYGASLLPIGYAGQIQIPLSVLLVVALGPTTEAYGLFRAVDCAIGGAVGIAAALLFPERPTTLDALSAQERWVRALVDQMRAIAAELRRPPRVLPRGSDHDFLQTSRELHEVSADGRAATIEAAESVAFNPRARKGALETVDRLRATERRLVRLSLQVRTISSTVDQLYDREGDPPRLDRETLATLCEELADLLELRWSGADLTEPAARVENDLVDAVEAVGHGVPSPLPVLQSVSLLGRLDQLRQDIVDDDLAALLDADGDR